MYTAYEKAYSEPSITSSSLSTDLSGCPAFYHFILDNRLYSTKCLAALKMQYMPLSKIKIKMVGFRKLPMTIVNNKLITTLGFLIAFCSLFHLSEL